MSRLLIEGQCHQGGGGDFAFRLLQEGQFQSVDVQFDGAGCDLIFRRAGETELADGHGAGRLHSGAEGAAGERTGVVQVAGAGRRVQHGAGLVVVRRLMEHPIRGIAGVFTPQTRGNGGGALTDSRGARRLAGLQIRQAAAQAGGVQPADLEGTPAAIAAAGTARQPGAGSAAGLGHRGIDNLNQFFRHCL